MPRHSCKNGPCLCPPHPDVLQAKVTSAAGQAVSFVAEASIGDSGTLPRGPTTGRRPGLNDGVTRPPGTISPDLKLSEIKKISLNKRAAVNEAKELRLLVVLVEFKDKKFKDNGLEYFENLFFSSDKLESGSAAEYYHEVSNDQVRLTGDVVGPYLLPETMAHYCNGNSGFSEEEPNAQTMARDALGLITYHPTNPVDIAKYDSADEDNFVDGLVIVHAGSGAESEPDEEARKNKIWSLQWNIGEPFPSKNKKVNAYAFLTIPEDALLGVTVHELGHLIFHWPDLYDFDYSSNGIGNWCLMAGGSWNALPGKEPGTKPAHPSAWCKVKQGWVEQLNVAQGGSLELQDIKKSLQVYRLWKNGDAHDEYFLLENRQKTGYDAALPGSGLFVWHIDDSMEDQSNEMHYLVALEQADGKDQLSSRRPNRGDVGDPFPGTAMNKTFNSTSNPNSKSYAGRDTGVSITNISNSGETMTMNVTV